MLLSEVRKLFKDAGYKLRVRSQSFGRHAEVLNQDGEVLPSIFFGENHRQEWIEAIELKSKIKQVSEDHTRIDTSKIYGFSSWHSTNSVIINIHLIRGKRLWVNIQKRI